jgi:cell division septum initiation protein DivIVA
MTDTDNNLAQQLMERMSAIAQREEEAAAVLRKAADDADRLRDAAERNAAEIVARAKVQAAQILQDARDGGGRILADAGTRSTGVAEPPASGFSRLWDAADTEAALPAPPDEFFAEMSERNAQEFFKS